MCFISLHANESFPINYFIDCKQFFLFQQGKDANMADILESENTCVSEEPIIAEPSNRGVIV